MYDFEKEIDKIWPEIETELKQSPYYSKPIAEGYAKLAGELEEEVVSLNNEKTFIRGYRKYRELKGAVLDCLEDIDDEIKEWKCRIRHLRSIGERLRSVQSVEENGASLSFQPV